MSASLTVKQYDTYPPLQATLTDSNGPINLTSAVSIKFVMKGQNTSTVVTGTCSVVNATTGQVSYSWASTDLDVVDTYSVEFAIHWSSGVQKVPNASINNPTVEVDGDLNGPTE